MSERPPDIEYAKPKPPADRRETARMVELLGICSFSAALMFGFITFVVSRKDAPYTPEYAAFLANYRAQQRADPPGTFRPIPPFDGQTRIPRPLLGLPTTYLATGFSMAGVASLVLAERMRISSRPLRDRVR